MLRPCAKLKSNNEKDKFVIGVLKQFGTQWQVSNIYKQIACRVRKKRKQNCYHLFIRDLVENLVKCFLLNVLKIQFI